LAEHLFLTDYNDTEDGRYSLAAALSVATKICINNPLNIWISKPLGENGVPFANVVVFYRYSLLDAIRNLFSAF